MPGDEIPDFPEPAGPAPRASVPVTIEGAAEKRARLLADKRKRDEAEVNAAKDRELEALELEAKYCAELGPRGLAFDILATRLGPIALKLPAEIQFKDIRAAFTGNALPTQEQLAGFVLPNVLAPERAKFLDMVGRHPGIYVGAGTLIAALCNAEEIETRGK